MTRSAITAAAALAPALALAPSPAAAQAAGYPPEVHPVEVRSSVDGAVGRALFFAPPDAQEEPVPLLVALHTWSGDWRQTTSAPLAEGCIARGWAFVHPDFRGPNRTPEACGSELAVADVIDAVHWVRRSSGAAIDPRRIYLAGVSGGGHMSLLMAGRAPGLWAGVSAWVPISDCAAWHAECTRSGRRYARDLELACGGKPGDGPVVDAEYRRRSPLTWLGAAADAGVAVDIGTGIRDGHDGSVPISHSLRAFNLLADEADRLTPGQIDSFTRTAEVPASLERAAPDPSFGDEKKPLWRRSSRRARVTIFDGGHEMVPAAIFAWLEKQRRGHDAPEIPATPVWDGRRPVPTTPGVSTLENVTFHVIKRREPEVDGYNWLHGVALEWHGEKLYATFGLNRGAENTAGEIAAGRASDDGGETWGPLFTIDDGSAAGPDGAVSHGVLLSHGGKLWAFQGAFTGRRKNVHTRAYTLESENEASGRWTAHGTVIEGGFWPMQRPARLPGGNWIMAGFIAGGANPPAVAISRGDDLLRWDLVAVPLAPGLGAVWGESAVIVDRSKVFNIARYGAKASALLSVSEDAGRTWTAAAPSPLPMVTSKPYTGILSTGQRYLVATTTADSGHRRSPLTIAVGRPGENQFCQVYRIRDALHPGGPGESHPGAALAYPYAVEHAGHLYIAYANSGGRGKNRNSAELAVVPVGALGAE